MVVFIIIVLHSESTCQQAKTQNMYVLNKCLGIDAPLRPFNNSVIKTNSHKHI